MNLFTLACRNLFRRPLRTALAMAGLSLAIGTLALLNAFGTGYERGLQKDLGRAGLQMMLVPLGCPYDAAARVLQGQEIDSTLPEEALAEVRQDPAVAVAAPMLLAALPREKEKRTDLWAGVDESISALKPWWKIEKGGRFFPSSNSVILGAEAAVAEYRQVGDLLHSPELKQTFQVAGILERSGTSDDSLFFISLRTAQEVFKQPGRLTAVAIRLHDPGLLPEASERLQKIPGAQVATLTEVMGVFVNLIGSVRSLLLGISLIAMTVGVLGVLNTMLASVVERSDELALMRAIGASRAQVFLLLFTEAILLTLSATLLGLAVAHWGGPGLESLLRHWFPLAPSDSLSALTPKLMVEALVIGLVTGLLAVIYPGLRAVRLTPALAVKPA